MAKPKTNSFPTSHERLLGMKDLLGETPHQFLRKGNPSSILNRFDRTCNGIEPSSHLDLLSKHTIEPSKDIHGV